MDNTTDKDTLIEALLQERDELYLELSRLREIDDGALEKAENIIRKKDETIKQLDDKVKQLTDQLAWYRRKFWKPSSEKYIPQDPNQRKIDFEGLDILPQEKQVMEQAEKEIFSKGIKGLLFVGRCHDFTHYEKIGARAIMGNLLFKKYGEKVFQVFPGSNKIDSIVKIMSSLNHERIGFDVYNSPFATIMSPSYIVDASVPFAQIARGYIYLGPREQLHSNDVIKGFLTQEMFDEHQSYYEIDNERSFSSAEELDTFFQNNRWPKP